MLFRQPGPPHQAALQNCERKQPIKTWKKCTRKGKKKWKKKRGKEKRRGPTGEEWKTTTKKKSSGGCYKESKQLISKISRSSHPKKFPFSLSDTSQKTQTKHQHPPPPPTMISTALLELKPDGSSFPMCLLAKISQILLGKPREINRLLLKPGFPDN